MRWFQFLYSRLRKRIAAAINDLPERERLVMSLYYYMVQFASRQSPA
jgi:DNA-directed RNA polymerase specialized sigma subunit